MYLLGSEQISEDIVSKLAQYIPRGVMDASLIH